MASAMTAMALGASRRLRLAALTLALVAVVKLGGAVAAPAPHEPGVRIALPLPPGPESTQ